MTLNEHNLKTKQMDRDMSNAAHDNHRQSCFDSRRLSTDDTMLGFKFDSVCVQSNYSKQKTS